MIGATWNQAGYMRLHTTRLEQLFFVSWVYWHERSWSEERLKCSINIWRLSLWVRQCHSDSEAIQLAHAAKIVHNYIFGEAKPFTELTVGCQKESISPLLLYRLSKHDTRRSHYHRLLWRSDTCSTINCPAVKVQQHQAQEKRIIPLKLSLYVTVLLRRHRFPLTVCNIRCCYMVICERRSW